MRRQTNAEPLYLKSQTSAWFSRACQSRNSTFEARQKASLAALLSPKVPGGVCGGGTKERPSKTFAPLDITRRAPQNSAIVSRFAIGAFAPD